MRLRITVDDALVRESDQRVGPSGRSEFIVAALRRALDEEHRWDVIEASLAGVDDHGHDWDADPAAWVHEQRRSGESRGG